MGCRDFGIGLAADARHRGRHERRVLACRDARSGIGYRLTHEWDEAGTTIFVGARRTVDDERTGRSMLFEFLGQWELGFVAGFAPRRLRNAACRVEVYDRTGALLGSAPAPV